MLVKIATLSATVMKMFPNQDLPKLRREKLLVMPPHFFQTLPEEVVHRYPLLLHH